MKWWRNRQRRRFYNKLFKQAAERRAVKELQRAGVAPGWIERPSDWPEWSEENIKRFQEDWSRQARMRRLTHAAGAPVLTRNEARARLNLPPIPGGEERLPLPHPPKRWHLLRRIFGGRNR